MSLPWQEFEDGRMQAMILDGSEMVHSMMLGAGFSLLLIHYQVVRRFSL